MNWGVYNFPNKIVLGDFDAELFDGTYIAFAGENITGIIEDDTLIGYHVILRFSTSGAQNFFNVWLENIHLRLWCEFETGYAVMFERKQEKPENILNCCFELLLMFDMELISPGIFHIHIDAKNLPKRLEEIALGDLGFYDTDFAGHPEGYSHFEPNRHLTLKLKTADQFRETWKALEDAASTTDGFVGYLEGEYIAVDEEIPYHSYTDIPVPFSISRRRLVPDRGEEFRQTEFHLTFEKNGSNPELIQKLLDSGLYGAYLPKADGDFLVLTMQGYKKDIVPLMDVVRRYIELSGGAARCTIKEERAIAHKLFNVNPNELPEIADSIEYIN